MVGLTSGCAAGSAAGLAGREISSSCTSQKHALLHGEKAVHVMPSWKKDLEQNPFAASFDSGHHPDLHAGTSPAPISLLQPDGDAQDISSPHCSSEIPALGPSLGAQSPASSPAECERTSPSRACKKKTKQKTYNISTACFVETLQVMGQFLLWSCLQNYQALGLSG